MKKKEKPAPEITKLMAILGFASEPKYMDDDDFKEVSVWEIRRALEAAYEIGRAKERKSASKALSKSQKSIPIF
jgi:hypothetical protein